MDRHELRILWKRFTNSVKILGIARSYRRFRKKPLGLHNVGLIHVLPSLCAAAFVTFILLYSAPPVDSGIPVPAQSKVPGFTVSLRDKEFGWVDSKQAFFLMRERMESDGNWFFNEPFIRKDLAFTESFIQDREAALRHTEETLRSYIRNHQIGYVLTAGSEPVVPLGSKKAYREVIEAVKAQYAPEKTGNGSIYDLTFSIREETGTAPDLLAKDEVFSVEKAVTYLLKGTLEEKTYTVVPEDTVWSISRKHGLTMDEIIKANPELDPDHIYPGDRLSLIVPKPFLTVGVEYIHEYTRQVRYHTRVIMDPGMYRNESVIQRRGRYGEEKVRARLRLVNGLLREKEFIDITELSAPVTAVIRQGTARTPDDILVASAFLPEGVGMITSNFGPRWGRFHYGIDVSAPVGTPVHAYEEGTVLFAGHSGILGNLVTLKHENGLVTRYGHADVIKVRPGDKVTKGQTIMLSGNSGYSTGPHVHFEVRKSGVAVDPLRYLKNLQKSE